MDIITFGCVCMYVCGRVTYRSHLTENSQLKIWESGMKWLLKVDLGSIDLLGFLLLEQRKDHLEESESQRKWGNNNNNNCDLLNCPPQHRL